MYICVRGSAEMEAEITEVTRDEYFHLHYTLQYRAGWRASSGACGNGSCSHSAVRDVSTFLTTNALFSMLVYSEKS